MNEKDAKDQKGRNELNLETVDYDDVLKEIGFGRVQWIVLVASGLTLLMAMNEIIGIGIITLSAQCDLELSSSDKRILAGVSLIGNVLSSYFWGYLSDTIGRRPVLIASSAATNLITFILMFVPNFWTFAVLRFFVGLSISGSTNVIYAYLGEFVTARLRPVVINYASIFVAVSVVFVPAVGWLVFLMDWSIAVGINFRFRPWRLLPYLYVLPGLLSTFLLLYLPESPKILFALNRYEEAYASLDWICQKNLKGKTYQEVFGSKLETWNIMNSGTKKELQRSTNCINVIKKLWHETYPLFQRPLVWNFVICCILMVNVFMCSIGMSLWYPFIQNHLRFYTRDQLKVKTCTAMEKAINQTDSITTFKKCDDKIFDDTYLDFIVYGVMCIIGYALVGLIINKFGRKAILVGFLASAGACGIALLWILEPIAIVLSFSLFMVLNELCMSIINGIVVDLVPTHLRGQAVCICLMLGRLSSVIAENFIGSTMISNCELTWLLFSGMSIFCAALAAILSI